MVVGVFVHDLFQKALSSILIKGTKPNIVNMSDEILKSRDLAFKCYENLLSIDMVKKPLTDFMQKINDFININIKHPFKENQNKVIFFKYFTFKTILTKNYILLESGWNLFKN